MYRSKKFRVGLGASKKPVAATSSISTTTIGSTSTISNPQITSTPLEKENSSTNNEELSRRDRVLNERANIMISQQPITQQKQTGTIASNDDDFMIPASQFVQQSRYVSQRSIRMRSQLSTTQQTPLSYFESVLSRCGVELTARNSDISYTLNCDHLKFVIRLRKELTSHHKYPENVQHFLSGLMDTMKTQTQLNKVLSGCMVNTQIETNIRFFFMDTKLINFFFFIDYITQFGSFKSIARKFNERLFDD